MKRIINTSSSALTWKFTFLYTQIYSPQTSQQTVNFHAFLTTHYFSGSASVFELFFSNIILRTNYHFKNIFQFNLRSNVLSVTEKKGKFQYNCYDLLEFIIDYSFLYFCYDVFYFFLKICFIFLIDYYVHIKIYIVYNYFVHFELFCIRDTLINNIFFPNSIKSFQIFNP